MLPSSILFVTLIIRNSHLQMEGSGAEHHREVFNIGGSSMTTQMQKKAGGASAGSPRVEYTRVGWLRTAWGILFWYALAYYWLALTRLFLKARKLMSS